MEIMEPEVADASKVRQDFDSIKVIVDKLEYKDWTFVLEMDKMGANRPYLQIQFWDEDHFGGGQSLQKCRKWYLSYHMTDSEIVRTGYKALCAALDHERDELFKFDKVALFNPHHDLLFLAEFAKKKRIDIR